MAENIQVGRIVVGVDGSAASLAALRWAADEARLRRAEIVIVRAWTCGLDMLASYVSRAGRASFEEEHNRADSGLAAMIWDVFGRAPEVKIHPVVVHGEPARVLIGQGLGADLLVLGGHRSESPFRHTLGAVAVACLRRAPCPVVIIADPSSPTAEGPRRPQDSPPGSN